MKVFTSITKMLKTSRNVILYILTVIQIYSCTEDSVNIFKKLVSGNHNQPLIVHYTSNHQARLINLLGDDDDENKIDFHGSLAQTGDDKLLDEYVDVETLDDIAKETAKNVLFSYLRTSPDADSKLEDTKKILRQALRARCKKVTTCIVKCKISKPSCPNNCQKALDDSNLCKPPVDECKKPRCGKTMPPKWLL